VTIDDFVATSLAQIIEGVRRAQLAADAHGGRVNPNRTHFTTFESVEFDLAVTVQESTKTGGEMGVSIWAVKAETGGSSQSQSTLAQRLRFKVPIALPIHETTLAQAPRS